MNEHPRGHDAERKEQLISAFIGSEFRGLLQLVVIQPYEDGNTVLLPARLAIRHDPPIR
jgi:hypothetical protein